MITLPNNVDEYIFTKKLYDESLNEKIVNEIEMMNNPAYGHSAKTPVVDLIDTEVFDEMSVIVKEFAIECSHEYNNQLEEHKPRGQNSLYIDTHITGTECYMMWGLGYRSDEYTVKHDHWPATWSFTYYINPPVGASGLYFPTLDYELKIEHGLLVLIKGDVLHEVKPSRFEGRRYCVGGLIAANPNY